MNYTLNPPPNVWVNIQLINAAIVIAVIGVFALMYFGYKAFSSIM